VRSPCSQDLVRRTRRRNSSAADVTGPENAGLGNRRTPVADPYVQTVEARGAQRDQYLTWRRIGVGNLVDDEDLRAAVLVNARTAFTTLASSIPLGIGLGYPLRHDHRPRVEDELPHLDHVDCGEPDDHPVVAEVALLRQHVLVGLGVHERIAPLLRERKSHERAVARERRVDDAAHAELEPTAHDPLGRAGQRQRERPHVLDGHALEASPQLGRIGSPISARPATRPHLDEHARGGGG